MHLASLKRQKVKVAGETIDFRAGETIHTENSYKYSVESLRALARGVGWIPDGHWTDSEGYFCIQAFALPKTPARGVGSISVIRARRSGPESDTSVERFLDSGSPLRGVRKTVSVAFPAHTPALRLARARNAGAVSRQERREDRRFRNE